MNKALTLLLLTLFVGTANAATLITQYGTNVSFTYDPDTLYGEGNVLFDTISFQPTGFRAESLNGAGTVDVMEALVITIEATTVGYAMENFHVEEDGDYSMTEVDGGNTKVSHMGMLTIDNASNVLLASQAFDAGSLTAKNTNDAVAWFADVDISLMTPETKAVLTLENTLSATSTLSGDQAWIQKKGDGTAIGIVIYAGLMNPVPVPAAAWLFGSAILGLVVMRRKKVQV